VSDRIHVTVKRPQNGQMVFFCPCALCKSSKFPAIFDCHARASQIFESNMATASERSQSLKETLIESLTAILSPDQNIRRMGEDQLKVLEVTEGELTHRKSVIENCYKEVCTLCL